MSRSSGTRGEFFTEVINDQDQYPVLLTSFFDQFTILYNIIGEYENLSVSKDMNNMSFTIHTPSPEVTDSIVNRVQGEVVQVYNHIFTVSISRIGPTDLIIYIK